MFSHPYRYLFIFLLALGTFFCTILCDVYTYFFIEIDWYLALTTIFAITAIIWEGNRLVEKWLIPAAFKIKNKVKYFVLFFIAGNAVAIMACLLMVYVIGVLVHGYSWERNANPLKLNIIYACLANLLLHLLNTIIFFFQEYKRQWVEAEELRRSTSQAEIQLVKSQINPHFLFNNLNVLSAMVLKDNPAANKFIEEFASVYRYVLNNQDKEVVPLSTELEFINSYLFLLKKRFSEGLNIAIDIPDHYRSWHIVPAALQMLIENAIKHNIVSTSKPLHISIRANGKGTITVANNLQRRKSVEHSTSIGLNNIYKRYKLISGKEIIINSNEESFEVVLPLLRLN